MMMIVPLSILASITLNNFFKEIDFKKIKRFSLYSILFFLIALILNVFLGNRKKIFVWILLILFFSLLILLNYKKSNFKYFNLKFSILLIIGIVTLGFSYTTKHFYNYLELKYVFNKYLNPSDKSRILIVTFPRMVDDYSYFYKFKNPDNYTFYDWNELNDLPKNNFDKIYVLIERDEVVSLAKEYNKYIPKFLSNIPSSWDKIYYKKNVSLFKTSSIDEVKTNY